jgi:hypothetical protein
MGADLDQYFALNLCSRFICSWQRKPPERYPAESGSESLSDALAGVCMRYLAAGARDRPFAPQGQFASGVIVRSAQDWARYDNGQLQQVDLVDALNVVVHGRLTYAEVVPTDVLIAFTNRSRNEASDSNWSVAILSASRLEEQVRESLGSHRQNDWQRRDQEEAIEHLFRALRIDGAIEGTSAEA